MCVAHLCMHTPCVSFHDHLSPSPAGDVDEEMETFSSYLRNSNVRKLKLTKCDLSPIHIATILRGLNGNSSLEELVVTCTLSFHGRVSVWQCDCTNTMPTGQSGCVVCLSRSTM